MPAPSSIVPDSPASLDRVVLRGLERDPAKRYPSARVMAAEIDACLGVASSTEIGEWVERTAGDQLREVAARIALIERSAAESADNLPQLRLESGEGASKVPAAALVLPNDRPTYVWGQTTRNERNPRPASERPSPWRRRAIEKVLERSQIRSLVVGLGGSVLAVAVGVSLVFLLRAEPDPARAAVAQPSQKLVNLPPVGLPPSAPTAVVPTLNVEESRDGRLGASLARPRFPPRQVRSGPRTPRPARRARSTCPSADADCNPPYTADAKGHIHFKPNCL